jgi:WD40 repeat protein
MRTLLIVSAFSIVFSISPSLAQDSPLPADLETITAENAQQLQLVNEIGYGDLSSIDWSPDGNMLAIGSDTGVWLYDTTNFDLEPKHLGDYWNYAVDLTFSPNGDLLAFTDGSFSVYLINVTTGHLRDNITSTSYGASGLAFSPNGRYLAISGSEYQYTPHIWNVALDGPVAYLEGHTDRIRGLAYSPDGSRLVTTSGDGTIRIWDTQNYDTVLTISDRQYGSYQVFFSSDSRSFATVHGEGVRMWDVNTGEEIDARTLSSAPSTASVAMDSSGRFMITSDGTLWESKVKSTDFTQTATFDQWIYSTDLKLSPDDKYLAAATAGGIAIFDTSTHKREHFLGGYDNEVRSLAFSRDGTVLAAGSRNGVVQLWNIDQTSGTVNHRATGIPYHRDWVDAISFSPDGAVLVSASWDGTIRMWNTDDGELLSSVEVGASIYSMAFSNDYALLVVGLSAEVKIWEVNWQEYRLNLLTNITAGKDRVYGVAFTPDSKSVVFSTEYNTDLFFWNFVENETPKRYQSQASFGNFSTLESNFTQTVLAVGIEYGAVQLFDLRNDEVQERWYHLFDENAFVDTGSMKFYVNITNIAFNPDDTVVAAIGRFGPLYVADMRDGTVMAELHSSAAGLAFSPNGKLLASGDGGGTVKLWGVPAGGD